MQLRVSHSLTDKSFFLVEEKKHVVPSLADPALLLDADSPRLRVKTLLIVDVVMRLGRNLRESQIPLNNERVFT